MPRSSPRSMLAVAATTARGGLSMYSRGAALSVLAATVASIAAAPVVGMVGGLDLGPMLGGFDGTWSAKATPVASLQRSALVASSAPLLAAAGAVFALAGITILVSAAARAGQRTEEIGVRRAVGASRLAIAAMAAIEAVLLAAATLVASGGLTTAAFHLVRSGWPGAAPTVNGALIGLVGLAFVATFLLGGMFLLIPARSRTPHVASGPPLELYLAGSLLSVGLMVVTCSSLLSRHVGAVQQAAPGGTADGVIYHVTAAEALPSQRAREYAHLLGDLDRLPGVEVASIGSRGLAIGLGEVGPLMTDCGDCVESNMRIPFRLTTAARHLASADTFRAIGAAVSSGRGIAATDGQDSPRVAVVNRALALRHFQYGQPIGRRLQLGGSDDWYTVVGVVDEPAATGFGASLLPRYAVYLSLLQHPTDQVEILVRGNAALSTTDVANTIARELAPNAPTPVAVAESALHAAQLAPLRWIGRWMGITGWAAWIIAALGTLLLMQVWVGALIPELGIRRAVGARGIGTFVTVISRAAATGVGGVACALWFGPAVWHLFTEAVRGAPAWDPMLAVRYGVILIGVALAAALPGAWRAARTAPAELVGASEG